LGTLTTEQFSYILIVWQCWGIYWFHFLLACEDSKNWCRMFQPNINDHKPGLVVSQA